MNLLDNYVIQHLCQFMDLPTIARFARTNKKINQVCQQVLYTRDLKFCDFKIVDVYCVRETLGYLPPTTTPLAEMIAHIIGMTSTNIRWCSRYLDMCRVCGFYKKRWFSLTNDLKSKKFAISGHQELQIKSFRKN